MNNLKFNFALNEMQEKAKKLVGESIVINAPTGSGKTEAILLAIPENSNVSYMLPTITSCNFMFQRLCKDFDNIDVVLKTSLKSEKRLVKDPIFRIAIHAPDAPLISFFKTKQKSLREVLVLDELDNYPEMVKTVLIEYINMFKPQTIVASATLDDNLKECFKTFKTINYNVDLKLIKHKIDIIDDIENIKHIINNNKDKRIGIICNSIRNMENIKYELDGINLLFHHSQLTNYEKLQNENKLFEGDFKVCLSNDLISYSVDIDFDILIMELSDNMSLNIQRMGRNNRKNRNISYKNLYLINPNCLCTPPFISEYEQFECFSKFEKILTYNQVQKMRNELEIKELPSLEDIQSHYEKCKNDGLEFTLRPSPLEFLVYCDFVLTTWENGKKIEKTIKTEKSFKFNEIPFSYSPYENEENYKIDLKTILHIKGDEYTIKYRKENKFYLEEFNDISYSARDFEEYDDYNEYNDYDEY